MCEDHGCSVRFCANGRGSRPFSFVIRSSLLVVLISESLALKDLPSWGEWIPNTDGWRELMDRRGRQVMAIKNSQERWDAMTSFVAQSLVVGNFTKQGYEIVRAPPSTFAWLRTMLHDSMKGSMQHESGENDQIWGDIPKLVDVGEAGRERLLAELKPMHEKWGGVKLTPSTAYGMRVYVGGNSLTMHVDKLSTHIISSIFHVDRDVDEPWPIVIEGLNGVTAEVALNPGDMLFYESSKCLHGRPRPLKGRWYASVFVHYRPSDWPSDISKNNKRLAERIFEKRLGSQDRDIGTKRADEAELRITGTGFYEPGCPHGWCSLVENWSVAASGSGVAYTKPNAAHKPQNAVLAQPHFTAKAKAKSETPSTDIQVTFKNMYKDGLSLFFVAGGTASVMLDGQSNEWPYGSSRSLTSYPGHNFEARDGGQVIASWTITETSQGKEYVLDAGDDVGQASDL
eukprot:TRINITY_DN45426_c0_g1_i1.p1 TRINITY_DN45426_c0_g1~~TRINITY_DN45426_c0_g1_i1.p1  ORF type:complete len:456 (+),score=50.07 TRINITY_DN45426_c0_g1_i1:145-1512(+)